MAQRFRTVGDSPSTETRSREVVNRMLRLLVSTDESNDGEVLPLAFVQSDVLPAGKGHRLKTHLRLAQQHFSNRCRTRVHQHRVLRPTPIETNHFGRVVPPIPSDQVPDTCLRFCHPSWYAEPNSLYSRACTPHWGPSTLHIGRQVLNHPPLR